MTAYLIVLGILFFGFVLSEVFSLADAPRDTALPKHWARRFAAEEKQLARR